MANGARDFVAGFLGGYKIGADIQDRRQERKYKRDKLAQDAEKDRLDREDKINTRLDNQVKHRAELAHKGEVLKETKRYHGALEGAATERNKQGREHLKQNEPLIKARTNAANAAAIKASGRDPGLEAHLTAQGLGPAPGAVGTPAPGGDQSSEYKVEGYGDVPLTFLDEDEGTDTSGEEDTVPAYADGGLIEDKETILQKQDGMASAPGGALAPRVAPVKPAPKDQAKLGGELTEAIRAATEGIAEQNKAPAELPEGVNRGALQNRAAMPNRAKKGSFALTGEEMAQAVKAVDPEGKLPKQLRKLKVLTESYKYYAGKGDMANAKKMAAAVVENARLEAAMYGAGAAEAAKNGKWEDAGKLIVDGYNNHVISDDVMEMKKPGIVVFRDAKTGKAKAEINMTPEQMVAFANELQDGTAFYEALNDAAYPSKVGKTSTAEGKKGSADTARLDAKARKEIADSFAPGEEEGAVDKLVVGAMPAVRNPETVQDRGAGSLYSAEELDKVIKPIRPAMRDVATEMVLGSGGSISPEAASALVGKMLRVDDDDPSRVSFKMKRPTKDPKTKKPGNLELLIDDQHITLPATVMPQLKKIVEWQQKQANDIATRLGTVRDERTQAKVDKAASAASTTDIKSGLDEATGFSRHKQNITNIAGGVPDRLREVGRDLPGRMGEYASRAGGAISGAATALDNRGREVAGARARELARASGDGAIADWRRR